MYYRGVFPEKVLYLQAKWVSARFITLWLKEAFCLSLVIENLGTFKQDKKIAKRLHAYAWAA